jgi:phytoene dehydrogenase-like protein
MKRAIVVGAGPAGLTAANLLLDAGVEVTVLEAKSRPGGRAASEVVDGFVLNQGPHALYAGAARRVLKGLGIDPPGAVPKPLDPVLVRDGRPARPVREFARFTARVARTRPADVAHLTALEWLGDDPVGKALLHVATYTGPLDRLSADAADLEGLVELRQVNLAGVISGKALYERRFTVAEAQAALDGKE